MNTVIASIWGKKAVLEVLYDLYEGEQVTEAQHEALAHFQKSADLVNDAGGVVERHYLEDEACDLPPAKDPEYRYITPKAVYIPRDNDGTDFSLLCDYELDPEHGLALTFGKDEVLITTISAVL